eukprot:10471419-Lingulodinium_polyedra.AAC.1
MRQEPRRGIRAASCTIVHERHVLHRVRPEASRQSRLVEDRAGPIDDFPIGTFNDGTRPVDTR